MKPIPVQLLKNERPSMDIPVIVQGPNVDRQIAFLRYHIKENRLYWENKTGIMFGYNDIHTWHQITSNMMRDIHENG